MFCLPLRFLHRLSVIDPREGTVRNGDIQELTQGLPALLNLEHQQLVSRDVSLDLLNVILVELDCSVLTCRHCREQAQACRGGGWHRVREVPDELRLRGSPHDLVEDVAGERLLGDVDVQDGVPDTLIPLDGVSYIEEHLGLRIYLEDFLVEVRHGVVDTSNIIRQQCLPTLSKYSRK